MFHFYVYQAIPVNAATSYKHLCKLDNYFYKYSVSNYDSTSDSTFSSTLTSTSSLTSDWLSNYIRLDLSFNFRFDLRLDFRVNLRLNLRLNLSFDLYLNFCRQWMWVVGLLAELWPIQTSGRFCLYIPDLNFAAQMSSLFSLLIFDFVLTDFARKQARGKFAKGHV